MATAVPPSRFTNGLLPLTLPQGAEFVRVHWQANGPIFFGPNVGLPPANRFDAPGGEFRVLYAAQEIPGAFVETVLRHPGRVLRRSEVDARAATRLTLGRPLQLAMVFDEGLQWHGIHAGEISVDDYRVSRQLALDFYEAFPTLDGLAYRSRYNNGQVCYALFDRVNHSDLTAGIRLDFDKHPSLIDGLMRLYGAVFDTSPLP